MGERSHPFAGPWTFRERSGGSRGSARLRAADDDRAGDQSGAEHGTQGHGHGHLELLVRARIRVPIRPPPLEARGVAKPVALHVLVRDLGHRSIRTGSQLESFVAFQRLTVPGLAVPFVRLRLGPLGPRVAIERVRAVAVRVPRRAGPAAAR